MFKSVRIVQNPGVAQSGSALIVALVFLLVMTLIGTTAMQSTTQQERMAGNYLDRMMAFQGAEGALLAARQIAPPALPTPSANPEQQPATWWNNDANSTVVAGYANAADGTGSLTNPLLLPPRYVVEKMSVGVGKTGECGLGVVGAGSCGSEIFWCRYTARATGGTNNAEVILEEIRSCS